VVFCLEQGADFLHMVQLMPLHPKTLSSLALFKSRLFLLFWFQLTKVVLEKRPLNGCSCISSCILYVMQGIVFLRQCGSHWIFYKGLSLHSAKVQNISSVLMLLTGVLIIGMVLAEICLLSCLYVHGINMERM